MYQIGLDKEEIKKRYPEPFATICSTEAVVFPVFMAYELGASLTVLPIVLAEQAWHHTKNFVTANNDPAKRSWDYNNSIAGKVKGAMDSTAIATRGGIGKALEYIKGYKEPVNDGSVVATRVKGPVQEAIPLLPLGPSEKIGLTYDQQWAKRMKISREAALANKEGPTPAK